MDRFLHGNGPFALSITKQRFNMKKEIQIRRKEKISYLPPAVVAQARRKIGSIFDGMAPLSGLTEEQERKYLPKVLGVSINSQDYEKKVRGFWADMSINVPADGIVLNIGLRPDKEPENILDWIKYQWVLKHRLVVSGKEKMVGDVEFYIHDPEAETQKTNVNVQDKKAAYKEFIKLGDKPEVVDRLIRVVGKRNPLGMSEIMKENFLATIVENQPKDFYRVATDKDLELRDLVAHLSELGILRKIGAAYLYLDTEIGATTDEAIHFFKSKRNSQAITEMKAKLRELEPKVANAGGAGGVVTSPVGDQSEGAVASSKPEGVVTDLEAPATSSEAPVGPSIEPEPESDKEDVGVKEDGSTESDASGADFLNSMVD